MRLTCKSVKVCSIALLVVLGCFAPLTESFGGTKEVLIGLSLSNMEHALQRTRAAIAMDVAMRQVGVKLIVTDGRRDSLKQLADIESLIAQQVNLVLMIPNDSQALTQAGKQLKQAGIPLITFDRSISSEDYLSHVGVDNVEVGRTAAKYFAEKLNGKGNIVIIQGQQGASATSERQAGFMEVIKQYPNIKILADQVADYRRHLALQVMENLLLAHPVIDGVYCHNDEMALGASVAVANKGRTGKVMITGVDGQKEIFKAIIDGTVTATVATPTLFPEVMELGLKALAGNDIPRKVIVPAPLVDKENVRKVYNPNSIF